MVRNPFRPFVLAALACLAAAGCSPQWPVYRSTEGADARIRFAAPGFEEAVPQRAAYIDGFSREEYAIYTAGAMQAEFVYMTATARSVSFGQEYWIERMTRTWNVAGEDFQATDEARLLPTRAGRAAVLPYRSAGAGRDCVSILGEWDRAPDDPQMQPRKVLFGNICAAPGARLDGGRIGELVAGIGIAGYDEPGLFGLAGGYDYEAGLQPNSVARVDAEAKALVEGVPGERGNSAFPFNMDLRYRDTSDSGPFFN